MDSAGDCAGEYIHCSLRPTRKLQESVLFQLFWYGNAQYTHHSCNCCPEHCTRWCFWNSHHPVRSILAWTFLSLVYLRYLNQRLLFRSSFTSFFIRLFCVLQDDGQLFIDGLIVTCCDRGLDIRLLMCVATFFHVLIFYNGLLNGQLICRLWLCWLDYTGVTFVQDRTWRDVRSAVCEIRIITGLLFASDDAVWTWCTGLTWSGRKPTNSPAVP